MQIRRSQAAAVLLLGAFLGGCASTPPYQGMDADQMFELGARDFEAGDWDEAVRVFERFLYEDPTNARIVEARLYLARAYFNREDYLTSASEFSRIIDRHPGDVRAPEASLGICKSYVALSPHIQRDQAYTLQAFNACDNVVQDFGGSEVSIEAEQLRDQMREKLARKELSRGDFYFRRKLYDSGIIYYNGLLTLYPRTPAAAQALLRLYQSYTEIGWEREAEEARQRLLRDFPDSDEAREVRANGGEGGGPPSGPVQGRSP
ncbi:MAG: outer membrane protein assembly factor BamD [Gemmatimonadota bacterium]